MSIERKKDWCILFKTKFGQYIAAYSKENNVPNKLLALIIANELLDWKNVDGTILDGVRGGGVGYAQIAVETALREGISGYEDELVRKIKSNSIIPVGILYLQIYKKIHKDLLSTQGSIVLASRLLRKYIDYYDFRVKTNSFGDGFKKTGLFYLRNRTILTKGDISRVSLPTPILFMFCAMWNSGKEILDAKQNINDTNYGNAFIHAQNAEILFEYINGLVNE